MDFMELADASKKLRKVSPRYQGRACQRCAKPVTITGTAAEIWQYGSLVVGGPIHNGCALLTKQTSDTNPIHVLEWIGKHPA